MNIAINDKNLKQYGLQNVCGYDLLNVSHILPDAIFSPAHRNILGVVVNAAMQNDNVICTMSVEKIASYSQTNSRTVRIFFSKMEKLGLIYSSLRRQGRENDTTARVFSPIFVDALLKILSVVNQCGLFTAQSISFAKEVIHRLVDNSAEHADPGSGESGSEAQNGYGSQISQNTQPPKTKSKRVNPTSLSDLMTLFRECLTDVNAYLRTGIEARKARLARQEATMQKKAMLAAQRKHFLDEKETQECAAFMRQQLLMKGFRTA